MIKIFECFCALIIAFSVSSKITNINSHPLRINSISIEIQISSLNGLIQNRLNTISKVALLKDLSATQLLEKLTLLKNDIEKKELEIIKLLRKNNQEKKLVIDQWRLVRDRIDLLQSIQSDVLTSKIWPMDAEKIYHKIAEFISIYEAISSEILTIDDEIIEHNKIDISKFISDYTTVEGLTIDEESSDALRKLLLGISVLRSDLKDVLNYNQTVVKIKSKVSNFNTNEYIITLEVDAMNTSKYTGKLDIKIKTILQPKLLFEGKYHDYRFSTNDGIVVTSNNWYIAGVDGGVFGGKVGGNGSQVDEMFDGISNIRALAFDNENNFYTLSEYELYFHKKDMLPKLIRKYDDETIVRSLKVDSNNNWYTVSQNGMIYSGKQGHEGKLICQITEDRLWRFYWRNPDFKIFIDSNSNIYIWWDQNTIYFIKQGKKPQRLNFRREYNNIDIILSVALDKNDNLYMGRQSGVYYLKEGKEVKKVLDNQDVFLIMFDNNNDWWIGNPF